MENAIKVSEKSTPKRASKLKVNCKTPTSFTKGLQTADLTNLTISVADTSNKTSTPKINDNSSITVENPLHIDYSIDLTGVSMAEMANKIQTTSLHSSSTPKSLISEDGTLPLETKDLYSASLGNKNTSDKASSPNPEIEMKENIPISLIEAKWVTDDTVDAYSNILNNNIVQGDVHFLNPVITLAVKIFDDYDSLIKPLQLHNKKFIFFPVNDSSEIQNIGGSGSHWSLLLWDKVGSQFYHFDSKGDYNLLHAEKIAFKINTYFNMSKKVSVASIQTPKQTNNDDCGIHMLLTTDIIISKLSEGCISLSPSLFEEILLPLSEADIITKRAQLAFLVHKHQYLNFSTNTLKQLIFYIKTNKTEEIPRNKTLNINKTNLQKPRENKNSTKKKLSSLGNDMGGKLRLSLYSDSQGRGLAQKIEWINPNNLKVVGSVMPNACLLQVAETASHTKDDVIFVMGGTNDTLCKDFRPIYSTLEQELVQLSKKTPVLLTTIPARCDLHVTDSYHNHILKANNYIRELVSRLDSVHLIDLDLVLKRFHFTHHGLHLNNRGKTKLAYSISDTISSIFQQDKEKRMDTTLPINLVESNMFDVIEEFKNSADTAFSHCISADVKMTQGVAVVFREKFNRPQPNDFINNHLTCQKTEGATIYGLVTKTRHYQKPNLIDYDASFEQFLQDFKLKKFKQLICSPMGCVRDNVPIQYFAKKLVDFQHRTGAIIKVVSFDEGSGELQNGMSHLEFIKKLKQSISLQYHQLQKSTDSRVEDSVPRATPLTMTHSAAQPPFTHSAFQNESENCSAVENIGSKVSSAVLVEIGE
ncbi:hypothetical protein J6590_056169 [Homalodisca vitripennis]|nr:hypothetical protein J6590_056169 [Homalodisca vitripennis]